MPSDIKLKILNKDEAHTLFQIHETMGLTTTLDIKTDGVIYTNSIVINDTAGTSVYNNASEFNNTVFLNYTSGNSLTSYGDIVLLANASINSLQVLDASISNITTLNATITNADFMNVTSSNLDVVLGASIGSIAILSTEDATSQTSGASAVISGGLNVKKNIWVGQDVNIVGNLNVLGSQTIINSETLNIEDNFLTINGSSMMAEDAGIFIKRYQTENDNSLGELLNDDPFLTLTVGSISSSQLEFNYIGDLSGMYIKTVDGQVRKISSYDGTIANLNTLLTTTLTSGSLINIYDRVYHVYKYDESVNKVVIGYTPSDASWGNLSISSYADIITNNIQTISKVNTLGSIVINTMGNVGIKKPASDFALDISGNIRGVSNMTLEGAHSAYYMSKNLASNISVSFGIDNIDYANIETNSCVISTNSSLSNVIIAPNTIERMRINNSGFVGINTTAPSHYLDVSGDVGIRDKVRVYSTVASTSATSSSALKVEGGVSIGLNLVVGEDIKTENLLSRNELGFLRLFATESAFSTTSGSLIVDGGINIKCSTNILSDASTASILTQGGVIIKKDVNIGGDATISNIEFGGTLKNNGILHVSSQWAGTQGVLTYNGTDGILHVGIGTLIPSVTLEVSGGTKLTSLTCESGVITDVTIDNLLSNNISTSNLQVSFGNILNLENDTSLIRIGNIINGNTTIANIVNASIENLLVNDASIITASVSNSILTNSSIQNITNIFSSVSNLQVQELRAIGSVHSIASVIFNDNAIGINSTLPNASLDIITSNTFGQIYLGNTLQTRKIVLYDTIGNNSEFYGLGVTNGSLLYNVDATSSSHDFYAKGKALVRIDGSGRVGINTTNPSSSLDIITSNTFGQIYLGNEFQTRKLILYDEFGDDSQFYGLGVTNGKLLYNIDSTSSSHAFLANGEHLISINGDGNVCIGATSGGHKLNVNGSFISNDSTISNLHISSTTLATSSTIGGALSVQGDARIVNDLYVGGKIYADNYTFDFEYGTTTIGSFNGTGVFTVGPIYHGRTFANTSYKIIGSLRTTTDNSNVYSVSFKNVTPNSFYANIMRLDALGSGFTDPDLQLSWVVSV